MSDRIEWLCNIYGAKCGSGFAGNVYGIDGIAPTITCVGGGWKPYANDTCRR